MTNTLILPPNTFRIHSAHKPDNRLDSYQIEPGLDYIERQRLYKEPTTIQNVYSKFWMLYLYDLPEGTHVVVRSGRKSAILRGKKALLVPRFQLIEWTIPAGWSSWKSYTCFHPESAFFPKHPVCFPYDETPIFESLGKVVDFIRKGISSFSVTLDSSHISIHTSIDRIIEHLNESFLDDSRIEDIARESGIPHSTFTHKFSEYYGITPVAYRNILRSYEALARISLGEHVQNVATQVGYPDYSNFYRQFSKIIGYNPSRFSRHGFPFRGSDDSLKSIRTA